MKKATIAILVLALVFAIIPAASAENLKIGEYNLVLKTDFANFTNEQFFGYSDTLTNVEIVDGSGGGKAVKITSNEDKLALHSTAGITDVDWAADKPNGIAIKIKTGDSYVALIPKVVFQVQPEGFDEPVRYGVFALPLGDNFYLYDAEGTQINDYDDFEGGPGFPGAPGVYLPDNFDGYLVFDFVDVFFEDIAGVGIEDPAEIDWSAIHHMVFFIGNGDDITIPMENTEITFEGIYAVSNAEPGTTEDNTSESPSVAPEQSPQASPASSPVSSPVQTASEQPAASDDNKEDNGISTGAIIGIIAGVLVIAGVAIFFVMRKKPADKPEGNSDK